MSPPASQPPLPGGYPGYPYPPPQRTNGPAIASLVCGIVGCVPFVMSLSAVILGIVAIRKTRDPSVGGKTLAIVGLVLGIVGVAGWSLLGGFMLTAYVTSKPARVVAHQFALDLSTGNIPAAVAATGGMTPQQLTPIVQQMKPWGALTSTTFPSFKTRANLDGTTTCDLTGTATFASGAQKTYTVSLVKQGGTFKVHSFNFR